MSSLLQNEQFQWHILENFEWIRAMKECPQEPAFHAEGDVYVHTKMVAEELQKLNEFQALQQAEKEILLKVLFLEQFSN